jgi:hypothetical protein
MLRILGSPKRLCDGVVRREFLQAGGLLGLTLADLFRARAARAASPAAALPHFGRAKSCILLYLYGAPSQIETFDPKPESPEEVRGELGCIPSSLEGLRVCELLPRTARVMHHTTVVRSMTHPHPIHGVAFATTAVPTIDVAMELSPRDSRHWPYIGSVVDYMMERAEPGRTPETPRNIALPFPMSTRRRGEVPRAGPYPAFLGQAYNPVWTDFHGQASRSVVKELAGESVPVEDPYLGVQPDCRFAVSALGAPDDPLLAVDRLNRRRRLLEQLESAQARADQRLAEAPPDRFQQMAYSLLTSEKLRTALDLAREPLEIRESYGMTLFGQASLVARRLVEAGSKFVSVFWDEYGLAGSGWDTHWHHYPRMKDELLPGFDWAFSGLIADLAQRGLLDETLVVVLSEHGRTPKLTPGNGGGRDHWSRAYSIVLAGAGVPAGAVVGKTDRIAGDVVETPVSPKDVLATMLHLLGIDPTAEFHDRLGRPLPIAGEGRVRPELLA